MRLLGSVLSSLLFASTAFAQLEPGAIVVYRVGNGTAALNNQATPVFLDVFDADGDDLGTIPMPIAVSGENRPLTAAGTATTEGFMNLSTDCSVLTLTGYGAVPGTIGVSATPADTVPRVVGIVDAAGTIDTSTALEDWADASNPRSAISTDGTDLWLAGGSGGLRFAQPGASTSVEISSDATNLRSLAISVGQLFVSTISGTTFRVASVGSGLPTTGPQTIAGVPGVSTSISPFAFAFLDMDDVEPGPDVLYIARDPGGIAKYSKTGATWEETGTLSGNYRGLAAVRDGDDAILVATRAGNQLMWIVDVGGHGGDLVSTPRVLDTAPINTAYRGVAFAPATQCTEPGAALSVLSAGAALALAHPHRRRPRRC